MKIVSLNIDGHTHLERWLPKVAALDPDVLCLQEALRSDLHTIQNELDMFGVFCEDRQIAAGSYNAPSADQWGLAIFSKFDFDSSRAIRYWGEPAQNSDAPEQRPRHLLVATLPLRGAKVTVATTHFVWSPDGGYSLTQRRALNQLLRVIPNEPLILCGDFNAPRGGTVYERINERFEDALPASITTTLDPALHRYPGLRLVVDHMFYSNNQYSCVSCDALYGLSDHAALFAEILPRDVLGQELARKVA